MKFPNPFELLEKEKQKQKENMENQKKGNKKEGKVVETMENTESSKKMNYNVGFIIAIIVVMFAINCVLYSIGFGAVFKMKGDGSSDGPYQVLMKEILGDKEQSPPTPPNWLWSVSYSIGIFFTLYLAVFTGMVIFLKMNNTTLPLSEVGNAFAVTAILYAIIMGFIFVLMLIMPGFVSIFEDTIGQSILTSVYGIKNFFEENFQTRVFPNSNIDLSFLMTMFHLNDFDSTFDKLWEDSKKDTENMDGDSTPFIDLKYIQQNEDNDNTENEDNEKEKLRLNLFRYTSHKYLFGHFTWTYLASLVTVFASINALM